MPEVPGQSVPHLPAFGGLRVPSYAQNQYSQTHAVCKRNHGDDPTPIFQDWRTCTRIENQNQSRTILILSAEGYFERKLSDVRTAPRDLTAFPRSAMPPYSLAEGTKGGVCPLLKNDPGLAAVYEDYDTEFNSIQSKCRTKQKNNYTGSGNRALKNSFFCAIS